MAYRTIETTSTFKVTYDNDWNEYLVHPISIMPSIDNICKAMGIKAA